MLETSQRYRDAITADARRTRIRASLRAEAPGVSYTGVDPGMLITTDEGFVENQAIVSQKEEILDGEFTLSDRYASLEEDRWLLDGTMTILADDYSHDGKVGLVSREFTWQEGRCDYPFRVSISGVRLLQAVTVVFPGDELDGYAVDLSMALYQGKTLLYSASKTGNTEATVVFGGFSVYEPTDIEITILRWSIPYRRQRVCRVLAGFAAQWTEDQITELTVRQQAAVSCVTLPYGTASLTVDNCSRVLDPRNKGGVFQVLEERQPVRIELGVDTEAGTEYLPAGVYYRGADAWTTGDRGLTMRLFLTDVVGLLAEVPYDPPDTLPTTLSGWVASLTAQLGEGFSWAVDPDYGDIALTAAKDAVEGQKCGDILRWICQATATFPRADARTGALTVEPLWDQGVAFALDELEDTPCLLANDSVGAITIECPAGSVSAAGDTAASSEVLTVSNPFLNTTDLVLTAARHILSAYGGNRVQLTGRGDPSSEIGDVATVELDDAGGVTGRVLSQSFSYTGGVLRGCRTELLQATGQLLYENRVVLTESGTWTAPAGVRTLYLVLVGGGQSGGHGYAGTNVDSLFQSSPGYYYGRNGAAGDQGAGGSVWYGTLTIAEGQTFDVTVGAGGVPGTGGPVDGGATTFGSCTSADGHPYQPAYTDIDSGSAYGRWGIASPIPGSGDGGSGGAGGTRGWTRYDYTATSGNLCFEVDSKSPTAGGYGTPGASGCVIIYYDKEESA